MDKRLRYAFFPASESQRARRGLTMIEILISTFIFATVLGLIGLTMITGTGTYQSDMQTSQQYSKANSLLDHVVKEFAMVRTASLNPNPISPAHTSSLQFQQLDDYVAGGIVWSSLRRIEWQMATGELNNGLDDNGNGLADEGNVVLIMDDGGMNELTLNLGSNVAEYLEGELPNGLDDNGNGLLDERGLTFVRVGDTLIIRITTQSVGELGKITSKTYTTASTLQIDG